MTAGSVLAPQILPLRISRNRAKHEIDTNTRVEIRSDTPDVTIHFTIDGSKPQHFKRFDYRDHNTFKYKEPITLPHGKISIKAVAITKDYRESATVTKVFVVEPATSNPPPDLDKDGDFLNCLARQGYSTQMDLNGREEDLTSDVGRVENLTNRETLWRDAAGEVPDDSKQDTELCFVCGAENPLHIKECMICESKLSETQTNINFQIEPPSVIPLPISRPATQEKKDQGTQTVGLFYPFHKHLAKKESEVFLQKEKQIKTNDHKSLLTSISPGRGYWRKQLDHICAHLRSYTQNNTEFRALIAEPQMGKLISATVHKDGYQVSLQINYALAEKVSVDI